MTRSESDLDQYLLSSDASAAEGWQLIALASLRRASGRPFTQRRYEALRQALLGLPADLKPAGLRQNDQSAA